MNWDDATTNPDPNAPRGRTAIAARLLRLEVRLLRLERRARTALFVVLIALFLVLTIWIDLKGGAPR